MQHFLLKNTIFGVPMSQSANERPKVVYFAQFIEKIFYALTLCTAKIHIIYVYIIIFTKIF